MDRRTFVVAMAGGLLATPRAAEAQQPDARAARVGLINLGTSSGPSPLGPNALREALSNLGYTEGQNLIIESRWGENRGAARLRELAYDLASRRVDVIVTMGDQATRAAKEATQTIPIVFVAGDPVGSGFVVSLGRPGANLTGIAVLASDLGAKRLQILKESFPKMSRIVVFTNASQPPGYIKGAEEAARAAGLHAQIARTRGPEDFDAVLRGVPGGGDTGILVLPSPFLRQHRTAVVDAVARRRLPAMDEDREFVVAGGLMSYGPSLKDLNRRAAFYVDRILKGAAPADLPIEQPTKFELVINLKTARAMGLTVPPSLLLQADQVIE